MKYIAPLFVALFLVTITPLPSYVACADETETAPAKSQQRKNYETSMEQQLAKLGKKLDELNAKAAAKSQEMRKDMKEALAEAEQKRQVASQKFEEMRQASKTEWQKFTSEMDKAMDDLKKAYERAKARLKE